MDMEHEQGSSQHNTHSQSEAPRREGESQASRHEQYQQHHHSPQPKTTATLTAVTSMMPAEINYNVNVQFDPATPQAGKPTNLSLIVTEQKVGEPIKQFDIIHDKIMHLVIVNSQDLSYFAHIHPRLDEGSGVFTIDHNFAESGRYKMWMDVKPKGGTQILTAFRFNVEGQPVHSRASTIAPDQTLVKKILADGQSYQVILNFQPEDLAPGKDVTLGFEIRDANGKPIRNLEPLMAAGGHCVIIDADAREFLHVHPAEEVQDVPSWRGGPSISFLANFTKPSLYRAWGQFQHEGRLMIADFTFEVAG